jgi:hypothetical protein
MEKFTRSGEFQTLRVKRFTTAHQGAVCLLRNEAPNVSVVNGEVRLNLMPFIAKGLEQVGQGASDLFGWAGSRWLYSSCQGPPELPPAASPPADTAGAA